MVKDFEQEAREYEEEYKQLMELFEEAGNDTDFFSSTNTASLVVNENKVLNITEVDGVEIDYKSSKKGAKAKIIISKKIPNQIHFCFGVLEEEFIQKLDVEIIVKKNASASLLSHCFFPNSKNVKHIMNGKIILEENAELEYNEEHFHNEGAYVEINTKIECKKNSKYKTDFKLRKGNIGEIKGLYDITLGDYAYAETFINIYGKDHDKITFDEKLTLKGKKSKGKLNTSMVLKNNSTSLVNNEINAIGDESFGHIQCDEVLIDNAKAKAIPIANVMNKTAKVTHEASIGTLDNEQIEYLMTKGLDREKAIELIIKSMLS